MAQLKNTVEIELKICKSKNSKPTFKKFNFIDENLHKLLVNCICVVYISCCVCVVVCVLLVILSVQTTLLDSRKRYDQIYLNFPIDIKNIHIR